MKTVSCHRFLWIAQYSATLVAALLAIPGMSRAQAVSDFYNVLVQEGADPSMVRHTNGWYYRTKSMGSNVTLWRSRSLTGTTAGESKVIWTPPAGTAYSRDLWAPELLFLNGKWYVYVAADDGENANHRMYVLENTNADPFAGSWTFRGQLTDSTNRWAIDGTVFTVGDRMYTIWSGWPSGSNGQQNLYIAEMSDPWTISSNRVRISTPTYSWETNTSPTVNEGPEVIIRNGRINLVYSASGSWTNSYCLGLITADVGSNLLSAASWTKRSTPVFSSANGIHGPGHHTFTKSPDGTEDWIVYHCARYSGAGWTRQIRAQKFTWNADDTPNFSTPVGHDARIALPSGEVARWRYEAEDAERSGAAAVSSNSAASGARYVGEINTDDSAVLFTVNVPQAGRYVLAARTSTGTSDGSSASLRVSVNGGNSSSLSVSNSGLQNWGVTGMRVTLRAGANTIRFTKGTNVADFDALDIFPYEGDGAAPAVPESLAADGGDRFVRLSWPDVTAAEDYSVWRSQNGGALVRIATGVPMPAFVDHTALNGANYTYAVTARSWTSQESAFSPTATASPFATPPRLVALYKMENGAKDSSSHGFHGVTEGGVGFAAGAVDPLAGVFNGTLANVRIPNVVGGSFTITCWVRTTATAETGQWWEGLGIVDGELAGVRNDFGIALVGDRVAFGVGNPDVSVTSSVAVNDGNWHHVAATRDAVTGAINIHVDGVWQSGAIGSTTPRDAVRQLRIGALQAGEHYFSGAIDEVRIYDGVLPAEALAELASPVGREVARYDLEGDAQDASNFHQDGSLSGVVEFAEGLDGRQAAVFDGTSSIVIPASVSGDLSVACWVKTTATGEEGQWYRGFGILDAEVAGVTEDFGLSLVGGKVGFGVGKPDRTVLSTRAVNDGTWHHVAATRSNAGGEVRVYIDGALDAVGSVDMPAGSRSAPSLFRIGAIATGARPFTGAIDEVRIFNHVISAAKVAEIGNRPPAMSAIPDQSIPESSSTGAIPVLLSDPDTPVGEIELTASSSNTSLVPASGIQIGGSGADRSLRITPNAHRAGEALITVTASDGARTAEKTLVLSVTTTPGGWWRQTWFGSTQEAGDARGSADPDGDGVINDWERFLGRNALVSDAAGSPSGRMAEGRLQLEYSRSLAASDLNVRVEWSRDLITWSSEGVEDVLVSTDGTTEQRRGSIPVNDDAKFFLRLWMAR